MYAFSSILPAYLIYAVAAMALFALRPVRQAALIAYFGGWLILPVAAYGPDAGDATGRALRVIGTALPSEFLLTKALVVPLVVLAGLAWRARGAITLPRPCLADAAMAAWCLSPLLPWAGGWIDGEQALGQLAYVMAVWGSSWAIGRLLLSDETGRDALLEAVSLSGLCLLPVALVEGLGGPMLYRLLYGVHPFQYDGAGRYFGARPLALFEHGNQYGIWIAMAALAAVHLALRDKAHRAVRATIACWLVLGALASQSVGAILLLLLGIAWLLMSSRQRRGTLYVGLLLMIAVGGAYLSGKERVEYLAYHTPFGQTAMGALKATGRGSLSWRIHRDVEALGTIRQTPLTGQGRWDWWSGLKAHPWGLPLLIAGQFGLVALLCLTLALLGGATRALWLGRDEALPLVVLLSAIDAQLNSFIYMPAILAAAAIATSRPPLSAGSQNVA